MYSDQSEAKNLSPKVGLIPGKVHHLTGGGGREILRKSLIEDKMTNQRAKSRSPIWDRYMISPGSRCNAGGCWWPHQRTQRRLSPDTSHLCWSSLHSVLSCEQETPSLTNEKSVRSFDQWEAQILPDRLLITKSWKSPPSRAGIRWKPESIFVSDNFLTFCKQKKELLAFIQSCLDQSEASI